jgi:hypothetical protein
VAQLVAEGAPAALDVSGEDAPSVLALVPEVDAITTPWRIQSPLHALQEVGYPCAWRVITADDAGLLLQLTQERYRPDALLFQRAWFTRWDDALSRWGTALRRAGTALFMDTDDNVFDPRLPARIQTLYAGSGEACPYAPRASEEQRGGRVAALHAMDGVTVSTPALAVAVRQHIRPGTPVLVVPNAIEPARYLKARKVWRELPRPRGGGPVVAWVGTGRSRRDFKETGIAEAWGRVARRYDRVTFVTVGFAFGRFDRHLPTGRLVNLGPVLPAQYPDALATFDIGCCPLEPGWFNECKSPQKAWELALCGAAVVASPTVYGDDPGYVEHGGLLAEGVDAWEHHLSRLIESAEERRARADALASWVVAERSLETTLWRWPASWRTIADQATRRPGVGRGGGAAAAQRARQKAKAKAKRRR